jgi:hypothetical protein
MRNVSGKNFREKQNSYFMFNYFFPKITVFDTVWNNMVQPDRPQMACGACDLHPG